MRVISQIQLGQQIGVQWGVGGLPGALCFRRGRGGGAEVHVHQPAVSLDHAVLQSRGDAQLHLLDVQDHLRELCRVSVAIQFS